ncbi:MAG: hypothetical protein AAGM22_30720 [Acidobacteriota bacterium]
MSPVAPQAPPHRRRLLAVAAFALTLAPILFHAVHLAEYGRLQRDGYYGVLLQLSRDGVQFDDSFSSYWNARSQGHRIALPALIWRGNAALTGGDNRATASLALALLVGLVALGRRFVPRPRSPEGWAVTVLLAWFLAGPHLTDRLARSFGGVPDVLAAALSLAAIAALLRLETPWRRRASAVALGVLGILTFGSSLALWPALALGVLWRRRSPGDAAAVAGGAIIAVLLFRQGQTPGGELPAAGQLIEYLLAFLGALPHPDAAVAQAVGAVGLLIFTAALGAATWRSLRPGQNVDEPVPADIAFWLMAATYAVGNGVLVGVGRGHAGPEEALAIRYIFFPSLFWVSLLALALHPRLRPAADAARLLAVAAVAALSLAGAVDRGFHSSQSFRESARWQRLVETQLRHGAWDADLLRLAVTDSPQALIASEPRSFFRSLGHIPWDRPMEALSGRALDPSLATGGGAEVGEFVELTVTANPRVARVGGWVIGDDTLHEVVFTDDRGRVRSRIHLWPHGQLEGRLKWAGLVTWHPDWKTWTPFAVRADGSFSPLLPKRYVASKWRAWARSRTPSAPPSPPATPGSRAQSPATDDPAAGEAPRD